MKSTGFAIFLMILAGGACPVSADDPDPRAHADFYIDVYGEVSVDDNPLVARAQNIFQRLRRVAEDPVAVSPALRVIHSEGKPWAIALPDGVIVLTQGALKICYQDIDKISGDARLAFVLGHELAHLTANDFWHRQVYMSLSGTGASEAMGKVKNILAGEGDVHWTDEIKRKELQADDTGFLYAALAGFDADRILPSADHPSDFLSFWVQQTETEHDALHLDSKERSTFLTRRFSALLDKAELFRAGIYLAHFGRYRDAQHLFEAFAHVFPSYKVENNLGYVHLHQGLEYLSPEQRIHFWLPSSMESLPTLFSPVRTLGGQLPEAAIRHFRQAEKYYLKAVKSKRESITSRINLTTVYFYLGEFYKARAVVEEARRLQPDSTEALMLRALIIYEQEKDIDMWPVAVRALKKLDARAHPAVRYNLARLYQERGRTAEANKQWRQLLSRQLPLALQKEVCRFVAIDHEACSQERSAVVLPDSLAGPAIFRKIMAAGDIRSRQKLLKRWHHILWQQQGPVVDIYRSREGLEIVMVDDEVAVMVERLSHPLEIQALADCCRIPRSKHRIGSAEIWSFGGFWSLNVQGTEVQEVWRHARGS